MSVYSGGLMDLPEFTRANLNLRLCAGDDGDAFQRFTFDALAPEYPGLHLFPTRGKDGAIDLSQTSPGGRVVVETKKIGRDDVLKAAEGEWKTVAGHLEEHLKDPKGPTKGQAQYGPWYMTDQPVAKYVFCISGTLANQNQRDILCDRIREHFRMLAGRHLHLAHLAAVEVEVLDWGSFNGIASRRPYLLYRWFPRCRPVGLVPDPR